MVEVSNCGISDAIDAVLERSGVLQVAKLRASSVGPKFGGRTVWLQAKAEVYQRHNGIALRRPPRLWARVGVELGFGHRGAKTDRLPTTTICHVNNENPIGGESAGAINDVDFGTNRCELPSSQRGSREFGAGRVCPEGLS